MSRRRSSRLKTAEPDADSVSQSAELLVNVPSDISVDQLKQFLPEDASLEAPTPDVIIQLYRLILDLNERAEATTTELDEFRADVQRKEVEMEQTVVDIQHETARAKNDVQRLNGELRSVASERDAITRARDDLQQKLDSLASNQTSSSAEALTLRQELENTKRSNRDLLAVVDRLKVSETEQQQEIDSLRASLKSARRDLTALQTEQGELKSADATNRFKVETLNQELALVREESERTKAELDTMTEEHATFRRSKHAELVQLQTELDSLKQTQATTQTALDTLRQTHTQQSQAHIEALQKINNLKADLADQEAKFRSELATQKRLVALLESRNEEASQRVQEVDSEWEKMVKAADEREAELSDKLARERQKVDALEGRVDDLRSVIDKMGSGELPTLSQSERAGTISVPGTPAAQILGNSVNGTMILSPAASLATKFQKTGMTFTEVYAQYVRQSAELAAEKQENARLSECLAQILADIEERAPTLQEQRNEYERMQRELQRLGPQLAEALQERDVEARNAQLALERANSRDAENTQLERQLSDLGRQVRHLLREIEIRENPALEAEAYEEPVGATVPDLTDTDRIITDQLTLFRSVNEMQLQNQRLLRVVRETSTRMESMEKEAREAAEAVESDAVRRAKLAMEGLHAKIKSMESNERALKKENEMLSSLLSRQKNVSSANGAPTTEHLDRHIVNGGDSMSFSESAKVAEMTSVLKEMGTNATRLQEELSTSQKQVSQLQVSLAKANAQIDYLNERHRMSDQTADMQRRELAELQTRSSKYQAQVAALEITSHQAQDQVREARSMLERLQAEAANLRAERSLLKDVETRLSSDVNNLNKDNARLNSLLRDSQTIQNDVQRATESERRRLESQVQSFEVQVQDLRTQLSHELERNRHITLQKEVEIKELHAKIERSNNDLSATREQLIVAQTNEKHLTVRIEDLSRTIQGSNEKLAVYERGVTSAGPLDISSPEELKHEVAELRAALRGAELDIEAAKGHAEQFKVISETSEQALADLQSRYDEYEASTAAEVSRLQAEATDLHARIQTLEKDLGAALDTNKTLQRQLEEQRIQFDSEKRELEFALADVNNAESNVAAIQASAQDDLRRQVQITQEANEKYERELLAHAAAVTKVAELKQQLTTAQAQIRDKQVAAETAQVNLVSSQASWELQKETISKELRDLQTRHNELTSQNTALHKHLESVSQQATAIRQTADQRASLADGPAVEGDDALNELRSVVAYLRREKEIVDLQLDLSRQETVRLRSQIDHLTKSLDETRTQLTTEREQAANSAHTATQHAELVEKINQLNILRESNATLRAESEANGRRVLQLEQQLQKALGEVDPLKAEVATCRAELAAREDHLKVLEAETERWRARNVQLLTQYKQVDPEELRVAKEESQTAKGQLDTLRAELTKLQESKGKLEQTFKALRTQSMDKLDKQRAAITKLEEDNGQLSTRIKELESSAPVAPAPTELLALRRELAQKTQELVTARQAVAAAEVKITELQLKSSNSDKMDVDSQALDALKIERDAAQTKLQAVQAEYDAAKLAWNTERQDAETKYNQAVATGERHKNAAKGFATDARTLKAVLDQHSLPIPPLTMAKAPAKAQAPAASTAPVPATTPAPAPASAAQPTPTPPSLRATAVPFQPRPP
ncbi:hypothetical protein FRB90_003320, partial [Tulasnella sp. 427]